MLTVGEILRQKREEQGLSIKTVVDQTYIQARFIIALECNDYSVFPAEAYTKGFLKNYSEMLGLDTAQMLKMFNDTKNSAVAIPCDDDYYRASAGLEPEVQKVADGRREIIEEARAAITESKLANEQIETIWQTKQQPGESIAYTTSLTLPAEALKKSVETSAEIATDNEPVETAGKVQDPIDIPSVISEPEKSEAVVATEEVLAESDEIVSDDNPDKLEQDNVQKPDEVVEEHTDATTSPNSLKQTSFKQKLAENRSNSSGGFPKWIIAVIVVVIAAAGYFLFAKDDKQGTAVKTSSLNVFKQNTTPPVQAKSLDITGKVNARCWASVVADGKTIFEDNLQPGSSFKWQAKDNLKVTIGNVSALADLKLNGQPLDLGQVRNNVVEKIFYVKDLK